MILIVSYNPTIRYCHNISREPVQTSIKTESFDCNSNSCNYCGIVGENIAQHNGTGSVQLEKKLHLKSQVHHSQAANTRYRLFKNFSVDNVFWTTLQKMEVCLAHHIWCAELVPCETKYGVHSTLIWCAANITYSVIDNTQCSVLSHLI